MVRAGGNLSWWLERAVFVEDGAQELRRLLRATDLEKWILVTLGGFTASTQVEVLEDSTLITHSYYWCHSADVTLHSGVLNA